MTEPLTVEQCKALRWIYHTTYSFKRASKKCPLNEDEMRRAKRELIKRGFVSKEGTITHAGINMVDRIGMWSR